MSKYEVICSDGKSYHIKAESMKRDGDWLSFTVMAQAFETRIVDVPPDAANPVGSKREIQVAAGRQQPREVAIFHKPISAQLLPNEKEPSDGNDA